MPTGANIISELFVALQANINGEPDTLFSLITREEEDQEIYFPRSEIIAIESCPPVDISQIVTPAPNIPQNKIYPAKLFIQENFLPEQEAIALYEYTLQREKDFSASSVTTGEKGYRKSQVLYKFDKIKDAFDVRIRQLLPEVISQFDLPLALDSEFEIQITASGQGDYFKIHNDNGQKETSHRQITFVYYFMKQPQIFSGGDLKMFDYCIENNFYTGANSFRTIPPINNSIIFFPSYQMHEVQEVNNDGTFENARFTVNGWFGNRKKETVES